MLQRTISLQLPLFTDYVVAHEPSPHVDTYECALTCEEEGVVRIPGWMLLRLEQGIKVPEAASIDNHLP